MHSQDLFAQFSRALSWNALSYITHKFSTTLISFLLYSLLSVTDFSLWANLNSIIFLLLLWLDCGLRRSIPRFCPIFARNKHSHRAFIRRMLCFQLGVLSISAPFFYWLLTTRASSAQLAALGVALFFSEGLVAIMRLIYHAHFWQRPFNALNTAVLLLKTIVNLACIMMISRDYLVVTILTTQLASGIIIIVVSLLMLIARTRRFVYPVGQKLDEPATHHAFIKHSAIMWGTITLKSLTERNFLLPLLTYTLGPAPANIFKVAHDGALFFYRSVLKTIGTSDTSLLSYAQERDDHATLLPQAVSRLTKRIISLCIPLLGMLGLISCMHPALGNYFGIKLFVVLTIGYLCEAMLSPYERLLEVKARYYSLLIGYIPYILTLIALVTHSLIDMTGLLGFIMLIHGLRLLSAGIMFIFAHGYYKVMFPLRYTAQLLAVWLPFYTLAYLILCTTPTGLHLQETLKRAFLLPFI